MALLPFANAAGGSSIGGSITGATEGSVLFAGSGGVLAQDNTNFFWDDTNNELKVPELALTERLGSEMVVNGGFTAPTQHIVTTANVSISPDQITISPDPGWSVGDVITYGSGGGAVIGGLVDGDCFFVTSNTGGVITFSATVGGAAFNMTGTGNNAQFFAKLDWFHGTTGVTGGTTGWTLYNGPAQKDVAGVTYLVPAVAIAATPGTTYKIVYTVTNWTVAGCLVNFGGVNAQASGTVPSADGTYTAYVTAFSTGGLYFAPVTGMRATISSISVKPLLSQITPATNFPIVFNRTLNDATENESAVVLNFETNKATSGSTTGLLLNFIDTATPSTDYFFQMLSNGASRLTLTTAGAAVLTGTLDASGTLTTASIITSTYPGAASAPAIRTTGALYAAGTGTTNFPQWMSQQTGTTAVTTWDTAGTYYGVNAASGFTGNFLDFHVAGGTSVFRVDEAGLITSGNFSVTGAAVRFQTGSTSSVIFNGTGQIKMPADGVMQLLNDGSTGFTGIKLGGLTSSFPYIKVSGASLLVRLADDSADGQISGRFTPRITTIVSNATPTVNTDATDAVTITALAAAITDASTNLSGTPVNFQKLIYRIKDDGTARAITWGASFEAKGVALPTTTVISKVLTVGFIYDTVTAKWGCVASAQEA